MPAHLREWWVAGLFFAGISAAEFCLGFLALVVASRRLWLCAVGISIATMAVWAFSRLWGMPVGPRAWQPEVLASPDYASTVLEAMTAIAFLALAYPAPGPRRHRSLTLAVAGGVIVPVLTVIALWSLHRHTENVSLKLHQKIVGASTAVHLQPAWRRTQFGAHRIHEVTRLIGNRLQRGARRHKCRLQL